MRTSQSTKDLGSFYLFLRREFYTTVLQMQITLETQYHGFDILV